jgi:hypothetical protein
VFGLGDRRKQSHVQSAVDGDVFRELHAREVVLGIGIDVRDLPDRVQSLGARASTTWNTEDNGMLGPSRYSSIRTTLESRTTQAL